MYTTVTFMGRDVTANAEDELPIKNHLPADLGASFRTLNQCSIAVSRQNRMPLDIGCILRSWLGERMSISMNRMLRTIAVAVRPTRPATSMRNRWWRAP